MEIKNNFILLILEKKNVFNITSDVLTNFFLSCIKDTFIKLSRYKFISQMQ